MSTELFQISTLISSSIGGIIEALDSIYLGNYSFLDIILALNYLGITLWFIDRMLNPQRTDEGIE